MDVYTLAIFGTLIGMQHALEADHLAAVATLNHERNSRRALLLRGSVWGLGHTITLLTICGALLLLGKNISPRVEAMLEFAVGAMIVFLGVNVLYRVWRKRPHFHIHQHRGGERHLHVHVHAASKEPHTSRLHNHEHGSLGLRRALMVGMMHGAAGSAGLLILAAAANSISQAITYVAAFGAGSILGMAALTFVVSYPLSWMERCANWVNTTAFVGIGCLAVIIGGNLLSHSWSIL